MKDSLVLPIVALLLTVAGHGFAAVSDSSREPREKLLLVDAMGHPIELPTNAVPVGLLPPSGIGLGRQFPQLLEGAKSPVVVQNRRQLAGESGAGFEFFPSAQPRLGSYLAGVDEFGNTALKPAPFLASSALDELIQQPKYWLSEYGLRYKLQQNFNFLTMSDVMQGDHTMGFYTLDLQTKWNVFNARDDGAAGWISAQMEAKAGLGEAGRTQDPRSNLGTINSPNDAWSSRNGVRIPELAWQQSAADGKVVLIAGVVSQRNYIDRNAYAQSAHTQFMNSALVHSGVMPLAQYNFGMNLQWQPRDEWYALVGASAGDAKAGQVPWADFSWSSWSVVAEFGYAPDNPLGLGPGVYRIQPFLAQAGGATQGGLCFNLQQQLGEDSPFGWFGRFGFTGSAVTAGASAQVGTGFVAKGPLARLGWSPSRSDDFAGVGFVWSQPSATSQTVYHGNEYALEAGYVFQFTPTIKLQPDLQAVWDPAFNPDAGPALVFQLQLDLVW